MEQIFDLNNEFIYDFVTGATQVHKQDSSHIVLDTGNKYQLLRQDNFPQDPSTWFPDNGDKLKKLKKLTEDSGRKKKKKTRRAKIPHKGYRKWRERPEPIQVICAMFRKLITEKLIYV